jgi:hypothetical protein
MLTLAEINERNAKFWLEQSQLRAERISDETIFELAQKDMAFEMARTIPIRFQKTLEQALADAAESVRISREALSRKGGKAPKTDTLQELIVEIVRQKPAIQQQQLFYQLNAAVGKGVISSVDLESQRVCFLTGGRPKTAPLSGLKDRLSRAKRQILSREPVGASQNEVPPD